MFAEATLANPHVSEEAKGHSKQVLEEMESSGELPEQQRRGYEGKNVGNIIGGHKVGILTSVIRFC